MSRSAYEQYKIATTTTVLGIALFTGAALFGRRVHEPPTDHKLEIVVPAEDRNLHCLSEHVVQLTLTNGEQVTGHVGSCREQQLEAAP